ncbi:MAG: hypothetical protein KAT34_12855 [Candidatus Aminicenantes bacterium]|nr:hypothetical protein [Candidatus Aminicenantes bacterium]
MKKSILLMALFCSIIIFTSCSQPGEVTVSKYFQAMNMNDKDTMGSMALQPKDLEFKSFEIVNLAESVEKDLELPILEERMKKLAAKKMMQGNNAMDASDDLEDLKYDLEVARGSRTKAKLQKQIEEAEKNFEAEKGKFNQITLKVAVLEKKITREREMIKMSTGRTDTLSLFAGKSHYQKIDVKVTLENGDVNDYVFQLRRTDLTLQDKTIDGRLIILKILTAADYEKEVQAEEAQEAEEIAAAEESEDTEEVKEDKTAEEKNE